MPISTDIWHEGLSTANIFDDVQEKNVAFLIDTSGSMYSRLDVVKQHLKEFLKIKSLRGNSKFNMIEFNSNVTQWSDKMVQCRSETIKVAEDWINKLEAKSGTNTEAALLAAYDESECDALCLVTDGLPDSKTHNILDSVACVYDRRPTHCIYITGRTVDEAAIEFLQDLATETYGSFKIVTVTNHGSIERIAPVYMASHGYNGVVRTSSRNIFLADQKQCSVTSTLDNFELKRDICVKSPVNVLQSPYILPMSDSAGTVCSPRLHPGIKFPAPRVFAEKDGSALRLPYFNYAWSQWYQPYLWARYRTARSWLQMPRDLEKALEGFSLSPAAGALLIDQPVLARMTVDGLYSKGTVKSQITNDKFLVELIPQTTGKYIDTTYHEVFIFDIVQYVDARRHAIEKDDKVLAPLNDRSERFCPGVVISGQEARDSSKDNRDDEELIVMFADGRSASVLPGEALWISQQLYDRIAFEMKLPSKVRQQISDMVSDYPEESYPGYPVTAPECRPHEWEQPRKFYNHGKDALYQPDTGLTMSEVGDVDTHVFGTDMSKSELSRKVDLQIKHHEHELKDSRRGIENNHKSYHRCLQSFDNPDDLSYSRSRQPIRQSNSCSPTTLRPRPRSARSRTRSLTPRGRHSVRFDKTLNECKLYDSMESLHRLSYSEEYEKVDSSTNTPLIRNGRVLKLKEEKDERPPWRYWKADPVPAMVDPPYHEPYNQTAVAEPLELRKANISTGVVEWGNSHFHQVVPNGRTNINRFLQTPIQKSVSFQTNANTNVCSGSNLVYKQSNEDRNLQLRQYRSQMEYTAARNSNNGVPGAMQDNYNDRILAQMGRKNSKGILTKKQIESTIANKEKLNAQLKRHNSNSYQREMNATSYSRQLAAMNQALASQSAQARRITTMSAKRQDRDTLQAARLLQQDSRKNVVVI